MNKELIDSVWACLPAEFRNEVKKQYQLAIDSKAYNIEYVLGYLFNTHNLTSNAEGEEMLTCVKDQAVKLYDIADRAFAINGDKWYQGYMKAMQDLFGSKCLPDEDASESASKEPQPAEPKEKPI